MRHTRGMTFGGAAMVLLVAAAGPALASFQDVLDTSAAMTPQARKAQLVAVVRAGERLVAVGARGHILTSDDHGSSWRQARVPVSVDLTAVWFVDARRGWAVGHGGVVLNSSDGGASWTKQLDGYEAGRILADYCERKGVLVEEARRIRDAGADKPFLDVWFADENTGYVVGAFNMIFRTRDGGLSWEPLFDRTDNPQRLHLYAIRPAGDDLFIVGEGGLVLKSTGGEANFQTVAFPYNGSLFGLLADGPALLVFGLRGHLFRSTDGGAGWTLIETRERSALVGGSIGPGGRLSIVAQDGAVLQSSDQGRHFMPVAVRRPMPLAGVAEDKGGQLVVVGFDGVRRLPLADAAK